MVVIGKSRSMVGSRRGKLVIPEVIFEANI
jgi:hypothetical protein